ncbi:MAG: class I SAM-dependent methyltransferase [Pseudomonadota bacterium]
MRSHPLTNVCHVCGAPNPSLVMDLGDMAVANAYLEATPEAAAAEEKWPLAVQFCENCKVMHVRDPAPAHALFTPDYAYFSSFSTTWLSHAAKFAQRAIERQALGGESFVVEVGSNDGYLLRNFVEADVPCLGVDPAAVCAEAARRVGVETYTAFFDEDTAKTVRSRHGTADLIVANNVLAHVPDVNGFLAGVDCLLSPDGVVSFEFPHLSALIDGAQFDTIYHEHYSYFSLTAVSGLLARHGLAVSDVEMLSTHGGSLRVTASRTPNRATSSVHDVMARESRAGLNRAGGVKALVSRANGRKEAFKAFLATHSDAVIAAYGAAAKGNTFSQYCGVGTNDIAFIADKNPAKQGRLAPGSHIPIVAPSVIGDVRPDFLVILPWNLRDEIMYEQRHIADWGGAFVLAEDGVEILSAERAA